MKRLALFLLLFAPLSCVQNHAIDITPDTVLSGTYTGDFNRANQPATPVSITFTGDRFSGRTTGILPAGASLPRICQGTFSVKTGVITFVNGCFYTAEFDWTLIIGYDWKATLKDNQLTLTRELDRYVLTKQ